MKPLRQAYDRPIELSLLYLVSVRLAMYSHRNFKNKRFIMYKLIVNLAVVE